MSPFLPLLMSDLRVLGFLFLSSFPPLYPSMGGEGVFLVELGFQKHLASLHSQVAVSFTMQSETSFGYLFYVFYIALHM